MSQVGRPSQKKQSSRKTKKAWRKNIDIDDIEESIEKRREEVRTFGEAAENLTSDQLFQLDVSKDAELLKKKNIGNLKQVKADEIIRNKSKLPGLTHPKQKKPAKFQGVSGKEVNELMKIAGRTQGLTSEQYRIQSGSHVNVDSGYDLWGVVKKDDKPDFLKKSLSGFTPATVVPTTLKEDAIKVKEVNIVPHAGKSYNPSLKSWQDLINSEFYKEKTKEEKRIELEKHQERIQHLIDTLDDNEIDTDSESDNGSADEEEDGDDDNKNERLSANKPVEIKIKTKAQRNRRKRHEERLKLEKEIKELKSQIHQLQQLDTIKKEVDEKQKAIESKKLKEKKRKSLKLGTKYHVIDDQLEVKLSDEISDSLRKLKPEGNLLYDQMRNMQSKGKIETRLPVRKKRKYTQKVTEKWTYKDFK